MIEPRKISDAGRQIIMTFEGLRLEAYKCPAGVLTIGYGHTRDPYTGKPDVKQGDKISKHQAEVLLEFDLQRYEREVEELCPGSNANQFGALVSFAYNLGVTALGKSNLRRRFLAGEYAPAGAEFMKWTYAQGKVLPGLVKRRAAERALFLTPVC